MQQIFIIDFDSAFVAVEGLEELAKIALAGNPTRKKIVREIEKITRQGMEGKIGFGESLEKRLKLLQANKDHISKLVSLLQKRVTPSVKRNREFFQQMSDRIYIVSGGFKDFIWPVVREFGIRESHVLANEFVFDGAGNIIGYDRDNPLAGDKGKIRAIEEIRLRQGYSGQVWVIGDGYTDWEIKKAGEAEKFFALTENVYREAVAKQADRILPNLDEFLYVYKLPRALSYPKHRIKVVLVGDIDSQVEQVFVREGYSVKKKDKLATRQQRLAKEIEETAILGIGSEESATVELLNRARRLWVVGVFGGRGGRVERAAATKRGIAVFASDKRDRRAAVKLAKKIIKFINTGDVTASVNMPQLALPEQKNIHRFIHIHNNVPGVLAEINAVLGQANINIEGQYLRTNREIGYLITDVNKEYNQRVIRELNKVKGTIRVRVLY